MLKNVYRYRNNWLRYRGLSYSEYLESEHWKELRQRFLSKKARRRCYVCGSRSDLEIHHKTYRRFGAEYLRDLIALCSDCHEEVHDLQREHPKWILWGIARRLKRQRHKDRKRDRTL